MNITDIIKHLPHRYPFLLIDRVLDLQKNKSIKALKNVTINEPFFTGHFPGLPVMPGVLILESMAQAAGVLALETVELPEGHTVQLFYAGIDNARFKRIVEPGDQMILDVELLNVRKNLWKLKAEASVNGELAATATLLAARRDVKNDS